MGGVLGLMLEELQDPGRAPLSREDGNRRCQVLLELPARGSLLHFGIFLSPLPAFCSGRGGVRWLWRKKGERCRPSTCMLWERRGGRSCTARLAASPGSCRLSTAATRSPRTRGFFPQVTCFSFTPPPFSSFASDSFCKIGIFPASIFAMLLLHHSSSANHA